MNTKNPFRAVTRLPMIIILLLSAVLIPSLNGVAHADQRNGESQVFVAKRVCAQWNTFVESDSNCWDAPVGDVHIKGWNEYDSWTEWQTSTVDHVTGPENWWWKIEKGVQVGIVEEDGWEWKTLDTNYPMQRQWVLITFTCNYWNGGFIGCDASYTTSNY